MKPQLIPAADVDRLDTWQKYRKGLCDSCRAMGKRVEEKEGKIAHT